MYRFFLQLFIPIIPKIFESTDKQKQQFKDNLLTIHYTMINIIKKTGNSKILSISYIKSFLVNLILNKEEVNDYAMSETPDGFPYLIVEADLYDDAFHDAYQVEFDNPDGYGTNPKRTYFHRFLEYDNDFHLQRISEPFYFHTLGIEYCITLMYLELLSD